MNKIENLSVLTGTVCSIRLYILCLTSLAVLSLFSCSEKSQFDFLTWQEIAALPVSPADYRIQYGAGKLQFGDLRLPEGSGLHPLVVVIHGGCWLNAFDLEYAGNLCAAFSGEGIATWSLEYRRVGDIGGGWPGTFEDVAQGLDYVQELAKMYPIDVNRVITLGHSAGGHLALWLAAREKLSQDSPFYTPEPFRIQGVVSLAGITDIKTYSAGPSDCNQAALHLLGGTVADVKDRYDLTNPLDLLPFGIAQRLIHGYHDEIVSPDQARSYVEHAQKVGDNAELIMIENAAHFELIAPHISAFSVVKQVVLELLNID